MKFFRKTIDIDLRVWFMIIIGGENVKIKDVEKITGLTPKAIRLYESKGLIHISRDENRYRNYSEDDIRKLKTIKLLRKAGISIADIKLYIFGVMSLEEIINKRKAEILKESGKRSDEYRNCENIYQKIDTDDLRSVETLTENEEIALSEHGELSVGIDIGTTTVSAVVYDIDNRVQIEAYSIPHNSYVRSDIFSEQSVSVIMNKAEKILYHILKCYTNVISIGVTGQMHGIVYIDNDGNSVSNLINWQDKRADQKLENGKTVYEHIGDITGNLIPTGYGIATHFFNCCKGLTPEKSAGICSIMDLFAMRICGLKKPVTHTSVAASFGLFDVKGGVFKKDKLSVLGIEESFLPCVTGETLVIGECRGIPVSVAIGDNQASFLGTVCENKDSILVNIGTGSQISTVSDYRELSGDLELRPFIDGKYLVCGSALCGGYAYSMVEQFFRSYVSYAGVLDEPQYKVINRLAQEAYENGDVGLAVDVAFLGKRSDPAKRGSVKGIGRQNFTPGALVLGVLKGMCNELYDLYKGINVRKNNVIASGGAVKKNCVLRNLIADRFGMSVSVNVIEEEAATGAALFSAYAVGKIKYNNGFSEYIKYL